MRTKHSVHALQTAALVAASFAASNLAQAVTIEERSLSQASTQRAAEPTAEWKLLQQLKSLQDEVSELRGRVEVYEAKLGRLESKQQTEHQALIERISGLEELVLAADEPEASTDPEADTSSETGNPDAKTNSGNSSEPAATSTSINSAQTDKQEQEDYLKAYNLFKEKGPEAGIEGMSSFIKQHPQSPLVARAHYWMGEFYLAQEVPNPPLAELNFMTIVKQYPKSDKAPTAIYRIIGLYDGDKRPDAKAKELAQQLVDNYPNSQEAALARSYLKGS